MLPKSLDPDTLRTVALVVLGLLVVLAFLVMRMVQKMVLRVIALGLLAGIGVFVWAQRDTLRTCVPQCACHILGQDVQVPKCPTPGQ